MRGRLFARNPAAWLLALFGLCGAPRRAGGDDVLVLEVDGLSGLAETSGLP